MEGFDKNNRVVVSTSVSRAGWRGKKGWRAVRESVRAGTKSWAESREEETSIKC